MPRVIKSSHVRMGAPPPKKPEPDPPAAAREEEERNAPDPGLNTSAAEKAGDALLEMARDEAAQMLREAREEAQQLVRQAEGEVEKLREQARQEAYAQGVERAEREVKESLERAQAEIDQTLEEAYRQRDAMMDDLEPRIFKLALEVGEKILGYELDHNENAFLSMLKQALDSVKNEDRVTLHVAPSEYVRFFKTREVTMHTRNGTIKAEVVNDPTVGYGGCLIETGSGAIDAGAQAQLNQISRNLGLEED